MQLAMRQDATQTNNMVLKGTDCMPCEPWARLRPSAGRWPHDVSSWSGCEATLRFVKVRSGWSGRFTGGKEKIPVDSGEGGDERIQVDATWGYISLHSLLSGESPFVESPP